VRVLLDLEVHLAPTAALAAREVAELEEWTATGGPDGLRHVGTTDTVRELAEQVQRECAADGIVLRPLALAPFLDRIPAPLTTLRGRLGLPRPHNRYATERG
jgi:alkanesulfonate monooxygenase SsuD/methylene tetrahydromethanopterin reductase-like flavin-dependent oxidoreductase (luciferase family)